MLQIALWWALRRALVYLKRVSISVERQAVATETLARISQDEWAIKHAPRPRGTGFVSGVMDVALANARWKEMNKDSWNPEADE